MTKKTTPNIAGSVVQNYINQNAVADSSYDQFLKNNDGWDRLKTLSNTTFGQITYSPRELSDFFSKPGVFNFVPAEEAAKTQTAITTLENTMMTILPRWEKLRAQHEDKNGAFKAEDDHDVLVTLGQEYINLSDHYDGLSSTIEDYLYGVMRTTEANITKAEEALKNAQAPSEQVAPEAPASN